MKIYNNLSAWCDRIDARIISLFSRNISTGIPRDVHKANAYYSFSYYDIIKVDSVEDEGKSVIKSAYDSALKMNEINNYSHQFMLAFTDITDGQNEFGYTKEEIDNFWKQGESEDSLFFLTMINLTDVSHLEKIFKKIQALFSRGSCLVYHTFDHCNIILFCREKTFKKYTELLFKLNYENFPLPDDTITLYSFSTIGKDYDDESTFEAFIRIGVKDYVMVEKFHNELDKLGKTVHVEWLLGRNDYSFYCPEATVKWLADFREKVKSFSDNIAKNNSWYTTYDLTIAVEKNDIKLDGKCDEQKNYIELQGKIGKEFCKFEKCYKAAMEMLGLTTNNVWLRWLNNSSQLAVSLMENYLSESLGTCLVPQFLDLLQYGIRFFEKMCAMQSEDKIKQRNQIEEIEMSFSNFFADIAILIDSINPTNCQFVQIPSFHLPSFEVQPKIMEFYVAMAYTLKNLFQDDDAFTYGLLIGPQFVNNLGVKSIALPEVLENDEWLEIVISEPSFHMIQFTMQTLGHEISHFVGQGSRCRAERRECIIKCAYVILVKNILNTLCEKAREIFKMPNALKINECICSVKALTDSADEFYNTYADCYFASDGDKDSRMIRIKDEVYSLANEIYCNPKLYEKFSDEIFILIGGNNKSIEEGTVIDYLRKQHLWQLNISYEDMLEGECSKSNTIFFSAVIKDMFDELMDCIIRLYMGEYNDGQISVTNNDQGVFYDLKELYDQILYYFSETFADLQAILVFNMDWKQYCDLIRHDESKIIADCPLRMLAVTKTLIKEGKWSIDSIRCESKFKAIRDAINLDSINDYSKLEQLGFNPTLVYYLVEYLINCVDKINEHFNADSNNRENLVKLQEINSKISNDNISILGLQKLIGEFVSDFRKTLIG